MDGKIMRDDMLETFSAMLKPARMILNMSRDDIAELSGLDAGLIADVEEGRASFGKAHYLALASVFDRAGAASEASIYRALIRVMTPEDASSADGNTGDFVLVRKWFETFGEEYDAEDNTPDTDSHENDDEVKTYEERLSDDELEDLAEEFKIFADTTALADENFPALLSRIEPLLREADAVIMVPRVSLEELREDIDDSTDEDSRLNMSDALKYVERRVADGLIKIRDYDFVDGDSESVLASVFGKFRDDYKFMLITQDEDRAEALMYENEGLRVARIDDKGDLIEWHND